MPIPGGVLGSAVFRGDQDQHRIRLERWWDTPTAPFALWIGMNPSGADDQVDDLTVRKECNWTRILGLGRYVKANVGSYRWTESVTLSLKREPLVHADNLPEIRALAAAAELIVLSVGKPPDVLLSAARSTFRALKQDGRKVRCLGVTQDGWPKHTSRLGYDAPFVDYSL